MSLKELVSGQVSTRFLLCIVSLVFAVLYLFFGPKSGDTAVISDVLGLMKVVVVTYVTGQTINSGLGKAKEMLNGRKA